MLEHKSVNISFFHSDSFEFADKNKASDDYAYDATGVKLRVRHVSPISAMSSDVTFHMDRFDTAEQSIATLIEVGEAPSVKSSLANLMQGLAVSNNMTIASDISGTSKTSSKTTSKSSTSSTLPKVQVSPAFELSEHDEHVTDYYSNLIYEDGVLNKIIFDGGCITLEDGSLVYHVYFKDHLGSNRIVADENGNIEQKTHYYAYGGIIGDISTNPEEQKFKYNGKEYETMHGLNTYDYGARQYDGAKIVWDRMDPFCEKYYNINPYVYCAGNPINAIDPDGCDTVNISYTDGKWIFNDPIVAKGDDVFNVTIDGKTSTYIFSEGEWGERVDALNLESNNDFTLGVYHVSGAEKDGTGYYVTPGGEPSTKVGSNARIPEGTYPIIEGCGQKWKKAGVGGSVTARGIRFHYDVSSNNNPRGSTEGCFVLSYNYYPQKNGGIQYKFNESKMASRNFDLLVGGSYPYINKNNGREATKFLFPITDKLILKSRIKWTY